jgi:hypothetical protein
MRATILRLEPETHKALRIAAIEAAEREVLEALGSQMTGDR